MMTAMNILDMEIATNKLKFAGGIEVIAEKLVGKPEQVCAGLNPTTTSIWQ
jgi:hypothetical protein